MAAIRRILGQSERAFDPELIALMVDAQTRAVRRWEVGLGHGMRRSDAPPDGIRGDIAEAIAKRIVTLTADGLRDPELIAAQALESVRRC